MPQRWMRQLPNALTIMRMLLVVPIAWLLLAERFGQALGLFALAGASDALDGFLARRFAWTSRVGAMIDPLADKLLLVTSYLCLSITQVIPWWLTVLVLARDTFIVTGVMLYRHLVGALRIAPTVLGKLSTVMQILLVLVALIELSVWAAFADYRPLLIVAVAVLAICSAAQYGWQGWRHYRHARTLE
ncbi:CDP-alcohol phosphatidyltransferase family protein [Atopomonas sediminilitoris]|uniref:CDP-alcohol phosphatidyltransferase family protein n=1 Tax=Atopomonas sediminilitoris TaxID=2919919 RepID=UPI001F4EB0B3|nr:CDP-alcohol phosphatidyltransferase family protein [Atopomonas sediminilitoris]MCJ8169290.1 CDP-alcohol phosphatidyltransferase family protein [Atopomonas sediminilitoris]